jgi:hypothetical protein
MTGRGRLELNVIVAHAGLAAVDELVFGTADEAHLAAGSGGLKSEGEESVSV